MHDHNFNFNENNYRARKRISIKLFKIVHIFLIKLLISNVIFLIQQHIGNQTKAPQSNPMAQRAMLTEPMNISNYLPGLVNNDPVVFYDQTL